MQKNNSHFTTENQVKQHKKIDKWQNIIFIIITIILFFLNHGILLKESKYLCTFIILSNKCWIKRLLLQFLMMSIWRNMDKEDFVINVDKEVFVTATLRNKTDFEAVSIFLMSKT